MAKFKTLPTALATFTIVLAAGLTLTFVTADPTSRAQAETTQGTGEGAPRGLRERDDVAVAARIRVIDGDTIEDMRDDITYRLVNIDTPETGSRARCAAERALGNRATEAARSLFARARQLELRPTGRLDRYGRTIAFVLIDGRDMGETLIADGLARPWRGRREPWCDVNGGLIP